MGEPTRIVVPVSVSTHPPTHEENDQCECRICHECDHQSNMIDPCACSGSLKWVHRQCLDQWRVSSPNPEAFWSCQTCKTKYDIVLANQANLRYASYGHSFISHNRRAIFLRVIFLVLRDMVVFMAALGFVSYLVGLVAVYSRATRHFVVHSMMGASEGHSLVIFLATFMGPIRCFCS